MAVAVVSGAHVDGGEDRDCSRIFGLSVGARTLRAMMECAQAEPIGCTASKATLVVGFSACRSDLFRHRAMSRCSRRVGGRRRLLNLLPGVGHGDEIGVGLAPHRPNDSRQLVREGDGGFVVAVVVVQSQCPGS